MAVCRLEQNYSDRPLRLRSSQPDLEAPEIRRQRPDRFVSCRSELPGHRQTPTRFRSMTSAGFWRLTDHQAAGHGDRMAPCRSAETDTRCNPRRRYQRSLPGKPRCWRRRSVVRTRAGRPVRWYGNSHVGPASVPDSAQEGAARQVRGGLRRAVWGRRRILRCPGRWRKQRCQSNSRFVARVFLRCESAHR